MDIDVIAMLAEILPKGWEHDADTFGLDFTLTCPHGECIEQDGTAQPCGCVSPLREAGLI